MDGEGGLSALFSGRPIVSDRISLLLSNHHSHHHHSSPPPELAMKGTISQVRDGTLHHSNAHVVVDSGAGLAYLLVDNFKELPFVIQRAPPGMSVILADDTPRGIDFTCTLHLTIPPAAPKEITLRLLQVKAVNRKEFTILLGRQSQLDLKMIIIHGSKILIDGLSVSSSNGIADADHIEDSIDHLKNIVELIQPDKREDFIIPATNPVGDLLVKEIIEKITKMEWFPVNKCPGISCRLRPLFPVETTDSACQSHAFELTLPTPTIPLHSIANRYYARSAYEKLSGDNQAAYRDMINEYLQIGWWTAIDSTKPICTPLYPSANVFLVSASGRKPRLVADFRPLNEVIPSASSVSPLIWQVLAAIRTESPATIAILDAKHAFYRNRLKDVSLRLLTGIGAFDCSRMCFGVSFGPGGLNATLGLLIDLVRRVLGQYPCMISLFVDDASVSGNAAHVLVALRIILLAMSTAGFEVPIVKFNLLTCENISRANLDECSPSIAISESGKLLGTTFSYVGRTLRVECGREIRLLKVISFVKNREKVTKQAIFAIAGCIAYDPLRIHADCRASADALRSLIGREFSEQTWEEELKIEALDKPLRAAYECLLQWMLELAQQSCDHRTRVDENKTLKCLDVFSDASLNGGGFIVRTTDNAEVLIQDAWRWKGEKQRDFHSNRRELIALHRCMQSVADLVQFRQDSTTELLPTRRVINVYCDNAPCVSWTQSGAHFNPSSSKAIERRAISRLVSSIADELEMIKKFCSISIRHIEGINNNSADSLSRLFDRPCPGSTSLGEALLGHSNIFNDSGLEMEDKISLIYDDPSPDEIDNCRVVKSGPLQRITLASQTAFADSIRLLRINQSVRDEGSFEPIAERFARHSYSISDLYRRMRLTRLIIQLLKWNSKNNSTQANVDNMADVETSVYFSQSDIIAVARSVQMSDPKCCDQMMRPPPQCGQWSIDEFNQVVIYRCALPTGESIWQLVIPKSGRHVRNLLVRDAHRDSGHSGLDGTACRIIDYHIDGLRSEIKNVLKLCVPCQISHAQRSWTIPPATHWNIAELLNMPPYHSVGVDFLTLNDDLKILSVTCLATKHSTWIPMDEENSRCALQSLRLVQLHRGGLRQIRADRASYFKSDVFHTEVSRILNAEVNLISARAPWENGLAEKTHDLGLHKLRVILRGVKGRLRDLTNAQLAEYIEYTCYLLNTRPLGTWSLQDERPITPDLLAFGYTRSVGSSSLLALAEVHPALHMSAVRKRYLSAVWAELKHKSNRAIRGKLGRRRYSCADAFEIGKPVLVFRGASRKLDQTFVMGHIQMIHNEREVNVTFPGGHQQREHHYNLVPVHTALQSEGGHVPDMNLE